MRCGIIIPREECFPYDVWLRVLQAVRRNRFLKIALGPIVYWRYRHYEFQYGVHVNANIEIGPGLHVVHGPSNLNAERYREELYCEAVCDRRRARELEGRG